MTLSVRMVQDNLAEVRWDRFVMNHPDATGYHLTAWKGILSGILGQDPVYFYAVDENDDFQGILPLSLVSSRIFGTFAVSLPALNYGGVLSNNEAACRSLLDAAMTWQKSRGAGHVELRQQRKLHTDWPVKEHKVSMQLALPDRYKTLWEKFPSKLRSQIRRAQREGMVTRFGGVELSDDFYAVFSRNMRDLGTPVYSQELFSGILRAFPREGRICVVYLGVKPVAAGFLYGFRDRLEIPWASALREHNRLAPNMLLYSAVLEFACEAGYHLFDFGRSTVGSSTYRFKEQWGARPVPLYWYYGLSAGRSLPEVNPQNPKYRLAIEMWKRLPVPLANMIGPHIARCLP